MESKKIIWHGSSEIIPNPKFGLGKSNNDYGSGFYCTESPEMSKEWACISSGQDGYANKYSLDMTGLSLLDLSNNKFTVLNWLAILATNRDFNVSAPIAIEGKGYLIENFGIDTSQYDIIKGYRADDSYFSFARAFVNNSITVEQLSRAMKLGKLGEQIVLKSKCAFDKVSFIDWELADGQTYFAKRASRNRAANVQFRQLQEEMQVSGLYMIDIIREGVKNDDTRLR